MAGIPASKRFDQLGIDLFTVGTDVDLEFTSAEEAATSEPRGGLELVIAQAQHLLAQIDDADVSGHARAVAEAAACQRLNGVIEAAKAIAVTDAYASAEESLIDDDATPGGYRRHAARTEEDCSDRYLSRRQLVLGDLGPALGLKASLAGGLLDRSLRLVHFMPNVLRQVTTGEWTSYHLKVALDAMEEFTDEQAAAADAALFAKRRLIEPSTVQRKISQWAVRHLERTDDLDEAQERGLAARRIAWGQPEPDGMTWMHVYLPTHEAVMLRNALGDYAKQAPADDPRTDDQLNLDVFLTWLHGPAALAPEAVSQLGLTPVTYDSCGMPRSTDPEQFGQAQDAWETIIMLMATLGMSMPAPPKARLNIDVPLATLLALLAGIMPGTGAHAPPATDSAPETCGPTGLTCGPSEITCGSAGVREDSRETHAWMEGLRLIGHSIMLWLMSGEPDLRRIVTDDLSGVPINYGPNVRHPGRAMRRRVQLRDRTCWFPYCHRHAVPIGGREADLDHIDPHRADGTGGDTSDANLIVLCREHHRIKHQTPWQPELLTDGSVLWTNALLGWSILTPPGV